MLNYEIKLIKERIVKHSETCIVMPTFNSKEITLKTILSLISNNKSVSYDILLVDNEGFDYKYIVQNVKHSKYQNLNYIVLQNNVGGAGAFYIGQKYAYDIGYKYVILTDNDANLIQEEGISILINSLKQYDIVIPTNIDSIQNDAKNNTEINFDAGLVYVTLSRDRIEELGLVNANYFLLMDDLDYFARASSLHLKAYKLKNCFFTHPLRKISLFYNFIIYLTVRNNLLFIFKNPNYVSIIYKLRSLKYLISYLFIKILHFLILKDTSILRTIYMAFRDFCCNLITLKLPKNNFEFVKVKLADGDERSDYFDINIDKNRILIKNKYFVKIGREGLIDYYILKHSDL